MEYHLEYGLRLHTTPEHKNLYSWAINEVDGLGQSVGRDQIPWGWTLYFTATSCTLIENLEISTPFEGDLKAPPRVTAPQVIRLTLRPGGPQDEGDYFRATTFSMFGTDRTIQSLQLEVHEITDPTVVESCEAWGGVSYTSEIDFRYETVADCIVFYLYVQPDRFARYVARIAEGAIDEIVFSVGIVHGFYSEWSPSISTRNIKVLASGREQKVDLPDDLQFEPPRLGTVGDARLKITRHLEFDRQAPEAPVLHRGIDNEHSVAEVPTVVDVDLHTAKLLASLRRPVWCCAALLFLVFIAVLLRA